MLCQLPKLPKLSPLQSRFLASVAALAVIAVIYWTLSDAHFAYAAELEFDGSGNSRGGQDHNWHRKELERHEEDGIDLELDHVATGVEARQATASLIAGNDVPNVDNILAGNLTVWKYPLSLLQADPTVAEPDLPANVSAGGKRNHVELRKRDNTGDEAGTANDLQERQSGDSTTVYISINTCLQPDYTGSAPQISGPAQLTLYVATDSSNTSPGPNGDNSSQVALPLDEGFAQYELSSDGAVYMSVSAPSLGGDFSGVWNYALAVSLTDYYHQYFASSSNLYLVDSDNGAALLVTQNLTESNVSTPNWKEWMNLRPPYTLFASNTARTSLLGVQNSFCALNKSAQIAASSNDLDGTTTHVAMSLTNRGLGSEPKQQFHMTSLNSSSQYSASLAFVPNTTTSSTSALVNGGGTLYRSVTLTTKTDGNCALLFDLPFCNQVAYAVPSNPKLSTANLISLYENYTTYFYQNFNYSLQQIPCNTTRGAQYSLARNCADCAAAYKDWLCAVSIPRCEDFSSTNPYLQMRAMSQPFANGSFLSSSLLNARYIPMPDAPTIEGTIAFDQTYNFSVGTNQSRNVMIDQSILPGPYKEVLPCEDLCYNLVQSCPAALGFTCPYPGRGLEVGYANRSGNGNGSISCSYMGAVIFTGAASAMRGVEWAGWGAVGVGLMSMLL